MKLNEFLTLRRKELHLTMKQVADNCDVSEATVSRWESGDIGDMKRSRIAKLAKTLKIRPSILISDDLELLETLPDGLYEPQPLSSIDDDLNKFLNSLGYNIEKYDNNQYSLLTDKGSVVLSQDEYDEFMNGLKETIRIEAINATNKYLKDYIMKFLQKAFNTGNSP